MGEDQDFIRHYPQEIRKVSPKAGRARLPPSRARDIDLLGKKRLGRSLALPGITRLSNFLKNSS
jgi:hypothetical protein